MALAGCGVERFTTDTTAPALANGALALDRESDLQFARESLPASLKTMEAFLVSSPQNQDLLFLLTRGFNAYAFGFIEADLERARLEGSTERADALTRRALLHYLRARAYGFRLLDFPELEAAALDGDLEETRRYLQDLTPDDVPALFWLTQAWSAAINLAQDDPDMVNARPVVEAILERILALDAGYMDGMPLAAYGAHHASRAAMFGGNPEKAKAAFSEAVRSYGDRNLLICYLYARTYAAQTQDRALFNQMMARVLDADVEKHPDQRLSNEIARERARLWVTHADEIFFE
jgi:hypothetical protein